MSASNQPGVNTSAPGTPGRADPPTLKTSLFATMAATPGHGLMVHRLGSVSDSSDTALSPYWGQFRPYRYGHSNPRLRPVVLGEAS